jgi:fibronectin type 3 domain-containing protein
MKKLQPTVKIISIILTCGLIISGCDDTVSLLPSPPSNVTATVESDNNVIISWDPVPDVDGYMVYYYYNVYDYYDRYDKIAFTPLSLTSIIVSGLYSDTYYSFGITAYNGYGESVASRVSVKTLPSIPAVPTNISASAASASSIRINWPSSSGAEGYKVYRSETSSGTYNEIALLKSAASTLYIDTGLPINTTFYYKVSAYNNRGESNLSSYASSFATTLPAAPANLIATARASGLLITDQPEICLEWDDVSNATEYIIYRSLTGFDNYTKLNTERIHSYLDSALPPEKTYYYKVAARNGIGDSPLSDPVSATTPSLKPDAPAYLSTSNITTSSIRVNWSASYYPNYLAIVSGYIIYRSLTDMGDYEKIYTTSSQYSINYTDNGLEPETTYYYKIAAHNRYGDSPLSDSISATTLPVPILTPNAPTGLSVTNVLTDRLTLSWFTVPRATNYVVYRSLTGLDDDYEQIYANNSTLTIYFEYELTPGTTYYYKVAARNSYGDSPLSDSILVTTLNE